MCSLIPNDFSSVLDGEGPIQQEVLLLFVIQGAELSPLHLNIFWRKFARVHKVVFMKNIQRECALCTDSASNISTAFF